MYSEEVLQTQFPEAKQSHTLLLILTNNMTHRRGGGGRGEGRRVLCVSEPPHTHTINITHSSLVLGGNRLVINLTPMDVHCTLCTASVD